MARKRFDFFRPDGDGGAFIAPAFCRPRGERTKAALVIDNKTGIVYQVAVGMFSAIYPIGPNGGGLEIVKETVEQQEED